jgi:hypothetical protein
MPARSWKRVEARHRAGLEIFWTDYSNPKKKGLPRLLRTKGWPFDDRMDQLEVGEGAE